MKTIIYIGRPFLHASALLRLKANGYRIGLFHDTRHTVNEPSVFDFIIDITFDSLAKFRDELSQIKDLPRIDGFVCTYEKYILFKAAAGEVLSVPTISMQSAIVCTDKYQMREAFLARTPSLTPQFIHVGSKEQLFEFAEKTGFPLILKPTNLTKSLLIHTCHSLPELERAYDTMREQLEPLYKKLRISDQKPGIIAEEFIIGKMCSVAAFVDSSGRPHLLEGIAELSTAEEAGFNDNFLYSRKLQEGINGELKQKILHAAIEGIRALSMSSSPAHVEIIYNETEVKIVEIGARIGGFRPFMYEQSYGIDMLEQEARSATGEPIEVSAPFIKHSAMYELFPSVPGEFVSLTNESPELYAYSSRRAQRGDAVGRSKDGFRAAAIIGVVDDNKRSFDDKCQRIEQIKVVVK